MSDKPDASGLQTTREGIDRMERGEQRVNEQREEEKDDVEQVAKEHPCFKDQVRSVKPPSAAAAAETPVVVVDEQQEGQRQLHEDAPGMAPPTIRQHAESITGVQQQLEQRAAAAPSGSTIFAEAVAAGSEPKRGDGVRELTCHFSIAMYKVYWVLLLVLVAVVFFVIGFYANNGGDCSCDGSIEKPTPIDQATLEPTMETTDPVGLQDPSLAQWKVQDSGNGHYYKPFQVSDGISWTSAEAEAVAMGGHLASITSQEENDFVFSLVSGNASFWSGTSGPWLGGFQPDGSSEPSGGFRWSDGEPFAYTNWEKNEPDDDGGENRIHFYTSSDRWNDSSGRWNDHLDNAGIVAYIAEWSN